MRVLNPFIDPVSETDMPTIAQLELDLLAVAFACDLTRVASFEISTALNRIRYPWVNSLGEGHTLFVRTPRWSVGRDERIVYTCTSSFEKK